MVILFIGFSFFFCRVEDQEVLLPTFTTWGRPVSNSRTQLHRKGFRPRALSLVKSLAGTMVLRQEG